MNFVVDNDGYKMMVEPLEVCYTILDRYYHVTYFQKYTLSIDFEVREMEMGADFFFNNANGSSCTKEHAEIFISGAVKWDGCINYDFPGGKECMLHACNRESLTSIGVLLGRIFDQCAAIILEEGRLLDNDIGQKEIVTDILPQGLKIRN